MLMGWQSIWRKVITLSPLSSLSLSLLSPLFLCSSSNVFPHTGETSLESFEISGRGRWQVSGASVEIQFPQLQKQNKLKRPALSSLTRTLSLFVLLTCISLRHLFDIWFRSVLVPGMGDSHVTVNDGFDIDVEKLVNAPAHGVHKWKRI